MKQSIYSIFILCLLLLPGAAWAQGIVGGDEDPDNPSTAGKNITVTQTAGGSITPAGTNNIVTVPSGENRTFTITPTDGYEIDRIVIDNSPATLTGDNRKSYQHTFPNVTAAHTISAVFVKNRFILTASTGAGGTITPAQAVVAKGGSQTFTITPGKGYQIKDLTDNSSSKGAQTTYTLDNITEDHTLVASFKGMGCTVTLPGNTTGGKLTVTNGGATVNNGTQVPYGSVLTINTTADTGYEMEKLTVNGRALTSNSYTVEGDVTFAVSFKKVTYPVTVNAPQNGTLSVKNGTASFPTGIHQVEYGTTLALENTPAAHYAFKSYTVNPAASLSGSTVTVTQATTLNATFDAETYSVKINKPAEGAISINGSDLTGTDTRQSAYGTVLQIGNTPPSGKMFKAYQVTPASALSGNLVTVTGNIEISVLFKDVPDDGSGGTGGGSGTEQQYTVIYSTPLIVQASGVTVASGSKVKTGTILSLLASNTNNRKLVSLTANGNKVDFATLGGLNSATYEVKAAVEFVADFQDITYPIALQPSEGGSLQATVGGTAVVSGNRYPYGSIVTVKATAAQGYTLSRILAGGKDITLSGSIALTEDLTLSAVFTKDPGISPDPDPANPDPASPVGIDLTAQSVVYNRKAQSFVVRTLPAGVVDNIKVSYKQNGVAVSQPTNAGLYDVILTRPADASFAELNETIAGGFEIRQATVNIVSVNYDEMPEVGSNLQTTVTLKGGKATYLGTEVKGKFTWVAAPSNDKLVVKATGFVDVRFTPDDAVNYGTATGQVHVQVGSAPAETYAITLKTEGEGSVAFLSGELNYPASGPFYKNMSLTLVPTAKSGYRFTGFVAEGVSYAANPYTFTVTKDLVLTARFVKKEDPANPSDPSKPVDPSDPNAPTPLQVTISNPASLVYDGKAKLISLTSTPVLGGWNIEYRDNDNKAVVPVDAGNYTVTVSREEDDSYLAYKETRTFTVSKAVPIIKTLPTTETLPKGASLMDASLAGGLAEADNFGVVPGIFEWSEPKTVVTSTGNQIIRFTPSDTKNFYLSTGTMEVTVLDQTNPNPVLITYAKPLGGSIEVTNEQDGKTLPSGSLVAAGTEIRIRPVANSNYSFGSFYIGSVDYTAEVIKNGGTLVLAVYTSKELTATFTRNPDNPNNPDNPDTPDTPDDPYHPVYPDTPTPDPGPSSFTVWVGSTGLGTITPGTSKVSRGGSLTFNIAPGYGQQLVDVRVNGNSVGAVNQYRLTNVRANTTVEAIFSNAGIAIHTLTSRIVGKGGSVNPTQVRVTAGSNHRFIIQPMERGRLIDVEIGTDRQLESIGTPFNYIFRDIKADSLLVATFELPTATETLTADSKSGIIYALDGNIYAQSTKTNATLQVYTPDGRLLVKQKLTDGSIVVRGLHEGVYITELSGEKQLFRKKVMIRR